MEHEERLKAALSDRYRIERGIGEGGMATVFLARDLKHDRQVAVKVLDPEFAQSLGAERFLREIKTAANLTHPHILPVHDSGEADGFLFYVMPFVDGESLRSRLTKEKQLPVEDAIQITREIADALDYAHRAGVIHRDVKPANIMLEAGHAVLADFGVAHALAEAEDERITRTGTSLGTPTYMSPEQGMGAQELDGRSDIYALGCVLYEMLGGEPPYTGPTAQAILAKRISEPVPRVTTLRETVPPPVEAAIAKALAKTPVDRFPTAGKFAEALRSEVLAVARPSGEHTHRPGIQRVGVLTLGAIILVMGGWWISTRLDSVDGPIEKIAVIPFRDYSGDTSQSHWVDGIHAAIISELQRIDALRVTPPQTVERFRDTELSPTEIARELGVDAILAGNVTIAADSVVTRLDLTAIRAEEEPLWSGIIESSIVNVLSFYREVAREVADQVGTTLTPEDEARLAERAQEVDPEAYELFLRGLQIYNQREVPRFDEAIELLQRSIQADPSFALAHLTLGELYQSQATYFVVPTGEANARAKAAALAAIGMDSTLALAHETLGWSAMSADYDWKGAEEAFLQAIELDEHNTQAFQAYGQFLTYMGRPEEGLARIRRAVELDSISPSPTNFLGYCLYLDRRYEEALVQQRKVVRLYPDQGTWHAFLAATLTGQESLSEAVSEFQKAIDLGGRQPWFLGLKAIAHGKLGQQDSADVIVRELIERSDRGAYVPADVIGWAYIGSGDHTQALDWLERAYEEHEQGLIHLKMAPWFDPLRSHRRFEALMRKMRFPEVSNQD